MKKTLFLSNFLMILVFLPAAISAQTTANKSWSTFISHFTSAIKKKDKAAVKSMMVSARRFSDGSSGVPEGDPRDGWLRMVSRKNIWESLVRSVSSGTKPYDSGEKRPWRVTTDNSMLFSFENGGWRFYGIMKD